jgi:crossover junction endodeoxyribonuclease RuvC
VRLRTIFHELQTIIAQYCPAEAGVESLYFARNASSAIPVAQARGVVFLALTLADVSAFEYPPQAIKQSIVGRGRAEKQQVQELVRVLLGLAEVPRPEHSADALAAAICHIAHRPFQERLNHV